MKRARTVVVSAFACALGISPTRAGQVLTFEGLKDFEPVGG